MKVDNFISVIEKIKNKSSLDISAGEDLSIALMNIISLEEHAFFSYIKTKDEEFLSTLEAARELRKKLLAKLVNKDESERWCMSKHLLAASMRLYEVGNRKLHEGKKEEAKEFYSQSAELYGMFWKLNIFDTKKNKLLYSKDKKKSVFSSIKKLLECCKE